MVTLRNSLSVATDPQKNPNEKANVEVIGAAVGNLHGPTSERVFVGPKELEVLQKVPVPGVSGGDNDLNGLVDFGWLGVIAAAVRMAEVDLPPYGPQLGMGHRHSDAHHQPGAAAAPHLADEVDAEDAEDAPQMKSIQEKYKKYRLRDPRKAQMNEEISALYKKEGVNPAGGCLPMLIQMPFLFAYYRMLGDAIDLRHAHWLWIQRSVGARTVPTFCRSLMVVSML